MLTKEFRESHSSTPWRDIIGMRHILVHSYYQVDPREVWVTVTGDLAPLSAQIDTYLAEMPE